jgi:hypothetical protein
LQPLATDKFHQWLNSHGKPSGQDKSAMDAKKVLQSMQK